MEKKINSPTKAKRTADDSFQIIFIPDYRLRTLGVFYISSSIDHVIQFTRRTARSNKYA